LRRYFGTIHPPGKREDAGFEQIRIPVRGRVTKRCIAIQVSLTRNGREQACVLWKVECLDEVTF
jgi:hypothetical protein